MKLRLFLFIVIFGMSPIMSSLFAEDTALTGFSVGLNYPGASVRYIRNSLGAEMRFQMLTHGSEEASSALILRLNKFSPLPRRMYWYSGLEGAYTHYQYKETDLSADGWLVGAYIGLETLLGQRWSWNIDIGPYYGQTFNRTTVSANVLEVALNSSLNFRLGGSK